MSIEALGQNEEAYSIRLQFATGAKSYEVRALGEAGSRDIGLALIDLDSSATTVYVPLAPLP